jgi:hypothetical protein
MVLLLSTIRQPRYENTETQSATIDVFSSKIMVCVHCFVSGREPTLVSFFKLIIELL